MLPHACRISVIDSEPAHCPWAWSIFAGSHKVRLPHATFTQKPQKTSLHPLHFCVLGHAIMQVLPVQPLTRQPGPEAKNTMPYFGERALLYQEPRAATVRVVSEAGIRGEKVVGKLLLLLVGAFLQLFLWLQSARCLMLDKDSEFRGSISGCFCEGSGF